MFKHVAFAAVAATALAAVPASAATFLTVTNSSPATCTSGDVICNFNVEGEVDTDGAFSLTSNLFAFPGLGGATGSSTNSAATITIPTSGTTNIDFTSAFLTNTTTSTVYGGTVLNAGVFSFAFQNNPGVTGGFYTLTLDGTATTFAGPPPSYPGIGGTLTFAAMAAVPEPATWAMFILGFGALGFAMRRRNAKVTVAKAALKFA